jgi:hypothetical protein
MRKIRDIQLRLELYQSDSKMSKKLEKASEILEKDSQRFQESERVKSRGQRHDNRAGGKDSDIKTDTAVKL